MMKIRPHKKQTKAGRPQPSLSLLTGAALLLPGLMQSVPVQAADDDEVDFGYSHYQEGQRNVGNWLIPNNITGAAKSYAIPKDAAPIEADSLYGHAKFHINDRIKFGVNYTEDTWAGATPLGSAPTNSGAYGDKHLHRNDATGDYIITHASPLGTGGSTKMDSKGRFYTPNSFDPLTGKTTFTKDTMTHVMGYASPETRKQGDFNLGYEWDDAGANLGGGVSDERDYESRFVNAGARLDFNQKRTSVSFNQSYTNSDVNALNMPGTGYVVENPHAVASNPSMPGTLDQLKGNRQDWNSQLGLIQVINKDALLNLGMGFSRNTGLLDNPYKMSWFGVYDPQAPLTDGFRALRGQAFFERRPDARNLWNWNAGWTQYIQPVDAALHFNYQFSHDDWAINAHTFDADWVQPLGGGWTLTPRVRYYSQSAASFYQPYFVVTGHRDSADPRAHGGWVYDHLLQSFSSDQRLSGYGAISGGLMLSKQFAKGISLDTGFEYYSHQGGLKLGGGGEQAFADYDYWVANANLKLNLGAMGSHLGGGAGDAHGWHAEHGNIPAGLMFAHTLNHAGEMMAGYRYQHSRSAGGWLHGDRSISLASASLNGCPGRYDTNGTPNAPCMMLPTEMAQSMHMLELMYAPNDWLTLMLMPQFMDMDMPMQMASIGDMNHGNPHNREQIGGIGDTGFYALMTLFDTPGQHLHASLGGTAPTGDVAQKVKKGNGQDEGFKDYSMQLGSGTWDFKPSLTYTGKAENWNWGAQVAGTKRMAAANASGYRLGDAFETSAWGGYSWTDWLASTLRLAYSWQDSIHGRFPNRWASLGKGSCNQADYTYVDNYDDQGNPIGDPVLHQADYDACLANINVERHIEDSRDHMSSQDYPKNYGGHYVDLGLGVSATIPDGAFAGHKLAFEWQQPMYTNVNGYQLNRDHFLTFTWSVGF